ncbi:MAG: biopolymer transporter ExbD [Planctomycetota bacterium]|nr:biopolymer transporter ExbD [Planctomycetota bacterium]
MTDPVSNLHFGPEPELDPEAQAIKRARSHRRRAKPGNRIKLNLTAMIDVVFLLLIYFMVATDFKVGEEIYRMDLPDRSQAQAEQDPFDLDEEPLRINVATSGLGRSRYQISIDGPYPQPDDFQELFEILRARQIRDNASGGLFEPDHPIVIQPTRTTQWEHAIEAFNAAARARYTNVIFAKPQ